ncbi:unnamed protein product [Cunninghamella echinulata]
MGLKNVEEQAKAMLEKNFKRKEDLVSAVSRHFANQTVKEVDTITCFLYTAHYRDSVLRLPLHM